MLNYLLDIDISPEEIHDINHTLNSSIIEILELSKNRVLDTLDYYKSIGVNNITELIINRPDLVLVDRNEATTLTNKLEEGLFVSLVNNNIKDLILFGV